MFEVIDTTSLSFHGYAVEVGCETLAEAMAWIGQEIEDGMGSRYSIRRRGSKNEWAHIDVDARSFDDED